jgi:two-component system nitrogen regulation sensor histidine kinase NtrY
VSFRTKLLLIFTLSVSLAVGLVAAIVSASMRRAFERLDAERTAALVAQFEREFARQGEEVTRRVEGVARADSTLRMAVDLNRPRPDYSLYVDSAREVATVERLDLLDMLAGDGTIVSSAEWPARFGYREEWVEQPAARTSQAAFLKRQELPGGPALALMAVRAVHAGERDLYIAGGLRLDREFLASLVLPAGMRVILYRNFAPNFSASELITASGAAPFAGQSEDSQKLAPLVARVRQERRELSQTVAWSRDPLAAEAFRAIPLLGGERELLGVLLVGSSRREQVALEQRIRLVAFQVGAAGVLLGALLSVGVAARVTRPVLDLVGAVRKVAAGDWGARVAVRSADEIGELAGAFNRMTQQLIEHRDRLVQAERVAAWRELARRLAHELKNPLFPLQITVENLLRARQSPAQFDEVFHESASTLLAELANLKAIIGRFSDFARMPAPQFESVNLNDVVRGALKVFQAQLSAAGRPPITPQLELEEKLEALEADPVLLHRAVENLVLNALDAMPAGGTLTLRTAQRDGPSRGALLEVSDTGTGLTREECERLFTPYYTTKHHGTGLGLAIVQSVVSDHGGKIAVESGPGRGSTFRIELPATRNPS